MKQRVLSRTGIFGFLFVFALVVGAPSMSYAQDKAAAAAPALKVVIVDVQKILAEAKAAKSIQKQIEDKRKTYQKEVDKQEETLRETEKKLVDERNKLSAEEFAQKKQKFETDVIEARKQIQEKRASLESAAGDALTSLRTNILEVVDKLAEDNGYDLILSRQNVMLVNASMDVTDEVMKALDKKVSEIKLKFE